MSDTDRVATLNDLSSEEVAAARALARDSGRPRAIRHLCALVDRCDQDWASDFVTDVLLGGADARTWRQQDRVCFAIAPARELVTRPLRDSLSALDSVDGARWVRVRPLMSAWTASPAGGAPGVLVRSVPYWWSPPDGAGASTASPGQVEEIEDLEIAGRRWIASQVASELRARPLPASPAAIAAALGVTGPLGRDGEIAISALVRESALPADERAPGFRGPDAWFASPVGAVPELEEFPVGAPIDGGAWVVTEEIRGDSVRGMYRATDRSGRRHLVTVTSRQQRPLDEIERELQLQVDGIARLRHIGPIGSDDDCHAMVEEEPEGRPSSDLTLPIAPAVAVQLASEVAAVLERAHAARHVVRFLRPELIYVEDRGGVPRVSGIAPRADAFLITASPWYGAKPLFHTLFAAPEVLAQSKTITPAADLFSLCAVLGVWLTGEHPFVGGTQMEQMAAIVGGHGRPWRGPTALGMVLARGMERDPRRRPSLAALVAELVAAAGKP